MNRQDKLYLELLNNKHWLNLDYHQAMRFKAMYLNEELSHKREEMLDNIKKASLETDKYVKEQRRLNGLD